MTLQSQHGIGDAEIKFIVTLFWALPAPDNFGRWIRFGIASSTLQMRIVKIVSSSFSNWSAKDVGGESEILCLYTITLALRTVLAIDAYIMCVFSPL